MERLSIARAEEILSGIPSVRVLVVGDLMLDLYISGVVERISPEAPVPVVRVQEERGALGGAANVAANAVALGAECHIVGCVGSDGHGSSLEGALSEMGVRTEGLVKVPRRPTTVKTRVLARRQQVVRFDHEDDSPVAPDIAEGILSMIRVLLPECDALALEDYNKGVLVPSVIHGALQAAREQGIPSVVDPKRLNFFEYEGTTVFKPNAKELWEALGEPIHPEDATWMEEVRLRLGCDNLIVTLGERGMAIRTAAGELLSVPTVARSVYDVSCAGDTVTAVVAAGLAAGATPDEAAILANHAAAVEVSKAGVATVSPQEILDHCRQYRDEVLSS
jgi:D-beta-D-heptose 7-phosphate kinase/D-beta-D-heptose 1-phosphate adenosyltransferase